MKIENLKCKSYKVTTSTLVATVQADNELAVRTALSGLDKITVYTDNEAVQEVEVLEGYKYVDSIVTVGDGWHLVKLITEPLSIDVIKERKISEITAYDESSNVNEFFVNGISMWYKADKRATIRNLVESTIRTGGDKTTLWTEEEPIVPLEVNCESALMMLAQLEVYAGNCLAVTQSHKSNVESFTTKEEVESYDYTAGYPEKPRFEL